MSYIGKTPTVGNFQVCDAISVVNNQAAYTMKVDTVNVSPESANHMIVSLNGVIQKPTDAFTVSGSTITFASNLVTGDVINFIQILGNVLDLGVPSDATVSTAKIVDGAVTLAKMASGVVFNPDSAVVFNESGADVDFRVESNNQSHMLFVDAGNDRIGILDNAPGHTLESGNSDSGKGWSLANENNVYKIRARSSASDTQTHIQFENTNGIVGTIKTNGTATQFNTSSDYRLKENVSYNFDATTRLKQLKPARFNFKADADTTVDGFIAHEVSSIVPEAVSGNKDATKTLNNVIKNADGSFFKQNISEEDWIIHKEKGTFANDTTWVATHTMPDYQGIDQAKLVPLLVKTIQELEARITTLENA